MSIIEKLQWRAAIKQFDTNKKLTAEQLDSLLSAVQLSPSSAGLQPYKILVVEDLGIREQLQAAAYNQAQITEASQLIIFAAETNVDEVYAKKYIDLVAKTRHIDRTNLAGYEDMVVGTLSRQSHEQRIINSTKQAYIALGVLLAAAAEMGIDACPMEGFDAAKFNEILGLEKLGLTAVVIAPVGFRSEADTYSKMAKVRRPKEELFINI